jgi:hypothetical protein
VPRKAGDLSLGSDDVLELASRKVDVRSNVSWRSNTIENFYCSLEMLERIAQPACSS